MPYIVDVIGDSIIAAYLPLTAVDTDSSVVKYLITGGSDVYIDLSYCYHYIKGEIETGTGNDEDENSAACPVSCFPYALFNSFELSINGKQVTQPNISHSYIPYLQYLFNFDKHTKETQLRSILWAKDTAKAFNNAGTVAGQVPANEGYAKRFAIASRSKEFEMYAPVVADVCHQPKLIINGCDIQIVFHRSRPNFCIMDPVANPTEHKFVISECCLYVRLVKPSPTQLEDDHKRLANNEPCLYPLIKTDIRLHTIGIGLYSKEITSVTSGRVPNRIIIGLVENAGLVGSYKHNPWNFEHANVRSVGLTIGGRQYPTKPLSLDYANNLYMRAYMQMFEGLGILFGDASVDITYEEFKDGYCLYVFDLTSAETANCGASVIEPSREADVNIHFQFGVATTKAYSCVVYTETPALMEINKDRNVYMEYTN
jgi:hypothetical protein